MSKNIIVFLIDDDEDDREIFELALNKIDPLIKLVTAKNGIEALDVFKSQPDFTPDFIFLDLNMPRMNGRQCLAEIKKLSHIKEIPVIIYSTSSDLFDQKNLMQEGAEAFVSKPSDLYELIETIKTFFK